MNWLSTTLLITFVITALISLTVAILGTDFMLQTIVPPNYYDYDSLEESHYFTFSGLALGTGLITFFTVTPMVIIDRYRRGSFFSYTVFEIVWLSVLWVLWLSSGCSVSLADPLFGMDSDSCVFDQFGPGTDMNETELPDRLCSETTIIKVFTFFLSSLLMVYTSILLWLSIRARGRGYSPWSKAVRDGTLLLPAEIAIEGPAEIKAEISESAPPVTIPQPEPSPPTVTLSLPGDTYHGFPEV